MVELKREMDNGCEMRKMKKQEVILENNKYYQMCNIDIGQEQMEFWEVNETISELAYLTHSYFRYYGKFPSKIGKLILDDLADSGKINPRYDYVLDNYAGSGTTLVEAKIKGFDSFGVDINPFSVLACKVKTRNYDIRRLELYWQKLYNDIVTYNHAILCPDEVLFGLGIADETITGKIETEAATFIHENGDALKWFSEKTIMQLAIIKILLLEKDVDIYKDFFELAFFAIIRRVSTAYDGEVRPHVNKKKHSRDVVDAYSKKICEMINIMKAWNQETNPEIKADAILCNNSDGKKISNYVNECNKVTNKELGLVISHPPYLNCFDYIPVFKLKFMWSSGFDDIFYGEDYKSIKDMEIKSYPASTESNIEAYFEHNRQAYQIIYNNLKTGGYCCIVIGDCTIQGKLFEVHKTFISMLQKIGFKFEKVAYRSTLYGIGQYAYKFRADYNENENRKKDGVLFFKKF